MENNTRRPLIWLGLFAAPSLVWLAIWIAALVRSSSVRFPIRSDSTLSLLIIVALIELAFVSLAYGAQNRVAIKAIGVGLIVFLLAVLANAVGIAAITFAGCACASAPS